MYISCTDGTFDVDAEVGKMRAKGKNEESIREWLTLVQEVIQAINSKQLFPTMRTQYMRTAFQIPFDATVRISLDTNLCMITERTKEVSSGQRW
jgi:SPX domain protein involved in polyphosphate accumulation